jgi:4-amino-4-deoxy-L-arabinose transferase-like glycosyltransferase
LSLATHDHGLGQFVVAEVHRRPLAALLLICLLAWLPGFFTLPPLDRDESRFAQATKQMLETGDFINIRLGDQVRYEKPVGIYWLQAASTAVFGSGALNQIWTYRVPSTLGALAAVAATFMLVRLFAGVEAAFMAGLLLGMSVLLMSEAKIAKTDAALLGCIVTVQAVLMRVYLSVRSPGIVALPTRALVLLGWAAFGLGVLIKGPLIAAVCGATVIAVSLFDREWRWLSRTNPLPGFALAVLIVAPWAIAIGIASQGQFYKQSLGEDFALKLMGEQEAHGAPPGYYALLMHATFWPGSFALLPGIVLGVARRREPAVRFLLLWAATAWLMFEFAPTKLPHYILPAYPAVAALCSLWITGGGLSSKVQRAAGIISLALFVVVGVTLAGFIAWAPEQFGRGAPTGLYLAAAAGAAGVIAVLVPALRGRRVAAAGIATLSAAILYYAAGWLSVPRLDALWLSPRLSAAVARHAMPGDPPVVTAGYAEPSISFLLGTRTALESGAGAGLIAGKAGGLALIDSGERENFLAVVAEAGSKAEPLAEITGLNYSRGRETRITLYRVVPGGR